MLSRHLLFFLSGISLAVLPGFSASAGEKEELRLAPLGPWQLDAGENKCRLVRLFGSDDDKTILMLDQWNPSTSLDWSVAGPSINKFRGRRKLAFSFGPDGDQDEIDFISGKVAGYGAAIFATSTVAARIDAPEEGDGSDGQPKPRGLKKLDDGNAAKIHALTLKQKGGRDVVLELGSMAKPLEAMNICMEDLVKHWGFDPERQRAVVTPAKVENLTEVAGILQRSYPLAAERRGAQANFHLRMTIAENGSVEDCKLINQTLAPEFDMSRHPCAILDKHAKIEPARDADGAPVRTYYTTRIAYRMM